MAYRVRPALILDLDGTIRYSRAGTPYIQNLFDIGLYSDVENILWRYKSNDHLILGVSNQGAIAYGLKTPEQIENEMMQTRALFNRDPFDDIVWATNAPGGTVRPYNLRSMLRKPDTGLLAVLEWRFMLERDIMIDWNNSTFVGDLQSDKDCAANAGLTFFWAWQFFMRPMPVEMR